MAEPHLLYSQNGQKTVKNTKENSRFPSNKGNLRRNSTGKPSSSESGQKLLPHYLRASTGSCHDFCKYGRKHALEEKERCPIWKRTTLPTSDKQNSMKRVVGAEEKHVRTAVQASMEEKPIAKAMITEEKKKMNTPVVKSKAPVLTKTHSPDPPEIIKSEVILEQVCSPEAKLAGIENKMNMKHVLAPKSKPLMMKPPSSSSLSSSYASAGLKDKKIETLRSSVKKIQNSSSVPAKNRVLSINFRKQRSPKLVCPLKAQDTIEIQSENGTLEEKTLHVIEPETKNQSEVESVLLSSDDSISPIEEENQESESSDSNESDFTISEENQNPIPQINDKNCAPQKLRFRRGKIVEFQPEKNSPRILKFRRGRVLPDNREGGEGEGRRRTFNKMGIDEWKNKGDPRSEKVVLRHQDVEQGRRETLVLLNNVIEETASKLVESRKSKVKALVGAFETVISLHEIKASVTTQPVA